MNEELLGELIGELHNLNLNLMELTQVIKEKEDSSNDNVEQSAGFYNAPVDYLTTVIEKGCPCPTCANNVSDGCRHHLPLYGKCSMCSRYMNDCVYHDPFPPGVEQL